MFLLQVEHGIIEFLGNIWIAGFSFSILLIVAVIAIGRRLTPEQQKKFAIGIGIFFLFREIFYQIYTSWNGIWSLQDSLPLYLCGITSVVATILMFWPNQLLFEFLALIGIGSNIQSIMTPELVHGADPYLYIEFYIKHPGVIAIALYLALIMKMKVRKRSWLYVFLLTNALIVVVGVINYFIDANYIYTVAPPNVNNPLIIGEWPWYWIGFEIFGLINILIFYAIFRYIGHRLNKKEQTMASKETIVA